MGRSDDIIDQAWREGVVRATVKRTGIGDVTENPKIVGPLVYVFAQLGVRSCIDALAKAATNAELEKGRRASDERPDRER